MQVLNGDADISVCFPRNFFLSRLDQLNWPTTTRRYNTTSSYQG
jgi:hypothetical protein